MSKLEDFFQKHFRAQTVRSITWVFTAFAIGFGSTLALTGESLSVWTTWRNAQYDVADENGILLGDIVGKIGSKTANSSLYADATHPNSAGYTKQAEVLKDLLLS